MFLNFIRLPSFRLGGGRGRSICFGLDEIRKRHFPNSEIKIFTNFYRRYLTHSEGKSLKARGLIFLFLAIYVHIKYQPCGAGAIQNGRQWAPKWTEGSGKEVI